MIAVRRGGGGDNDTRRRLPKRPLPFVAEAEAENDGTTTASSLYKKRRLEDKETERRRRPFRVESGVLGAYPVADVLFTNSTNNASTDIDIDIGIGGTTTITFTNTNVLTQCNDDAVGSETTHQIDAFKEDDDEYEDFDLVEALEMATTKNIKKKTTLRIGM